MRKVRIILCIGYLASGLLMTQTAEAKNVAAEILDILKANGQISDQQYRDLMIKAQAEDEKATTNSDLSQKVRTLEKTVSKKHFLATYWKSGLRMESADGDFKLKIGGRIMNDWAIYGTDANIRDQHGQIGDGTEFRRARIFLEGNVYGNIKYKAQYDFAGRDADFNDMYLQIKRVPLVGKLTIGHFKEPFSLQEITSSKYLTFMERSLSYTFSQGRNTGLSFSNAFLNKRATYGIGVFRETDDSGKGFGEESSYNVTTRFTFLPWYLQKGKQLLHLGLSYSHKFRNSQTARFRTRPEAHLGPRLVDTGKFVADDINYINPEIALVYGPASLQFEWSSALVNSDEADDPHFNSWYISGSYFLTGEHRAYNASEGAFGRIKLDDNFDSRGGWGALELAARYSTIDLDDGPIDGGELDNITVGLNWYLNPNVRIMFNYVHADIEDSGEADIFQTRFQVDF